MSEKSIVIIGLPESGKTTFLAALWHLVTARDMDTSLRFANLKTGNLAHLNAIAARWRDAVVQDRTGLTGTRLVSMNLKAADSSEVMITFPDVPGEAYRRMWEERECDPETAEVLQSSGVLLFVHSDTIRAPSWIVDEIALAKKLGIDVPDGEPVSWHPRLAPTQIQLIDLLQLLHRPPLSVGPRRLAILLSAWDKAEEEGLDPSAFFSQRLPMLAQYLRHSTQWSPRIYGVSAQGGEYDSFDANAVKVRAAEDLRNLDQPSTRIKLVGPIPQTHDLTEPLTWLMQ
ncbi:hypothetical protein ACIQUG_32205 [Ensifer sp. NPDC090286]|uniref:TRAFAC clade GTPase domain-containing protein n=1 Tax=Ensifer sp. NPDC090286 TaxID=3363991 RepID=UPI00383AAFA9